MSVRTVNGRLPITGRNPLMPPTLHEAGTRLAVRFLKNIRHRTERMAPEHLRAPFSWHEGRVQDLCADIDACLNFLAPAGSSMTAPLYELTRVPCTRQRPKRRRCGRNTLRSYGRRGRVRLSSTTSRSHKCSVCSRPVPLLSRSFSPHPGDGKRQPGVNQNLPPGCQGKARKRQVRLFRRSRALKQTRACE